MVKLRPNFCLSANSVPLSNQTLQNQIDYHVYQVLLAYICKVTTTSATSCVFGYHPPLPVTRRDY